MKNSVNGTPPRLSAVALLVAALVVAGCGEKKTELGEGGSVVSGSAGPAGAQGADKSLTRCDAPVATLALAENPNGYTVSSAYHLPASPVPLIRLIAQQSGCFRVVDRSAGLRATVREQELKEAGVLRQKSTVAKGQGYEAQYTLVPSLTFSEQDAGRSIAGVIAMIPVLRDIAGLIGLAAATGSARTTDLGAAGALFGRLGGGAGAGWSNTNEGKVIAAAFLDSHNKLVAQVRMLQAKELPPPAATQRRP